MDTISTGSVPIPRKPRPRRKLPRLDGRSIEAKALKRIREGVEADYPKGFNAIGREILDQFVFNIWLAKRLEQDLRRAGKKASDYRGPATNVVPLGARPAANRTTTEPLQETGTAR